MVSKSQIEWIILLKNIIQMELNSSSPKLMKNSTCNSPKANGIEQSKVYVRDTQNCQKTLKPVVEIFYTTKKL